LVLLFHFDTHSETIALPAGKVGACSQKWLTPMYFFHFPFVAIAWAIVLGTIDPKLVEYINMSLIPLVFVLAVLMTLYLSLWLNYWVEARFIRMGKRLESKWFTR
jgi:peptidoglycan/LPS O-acetylase OafA/YrhL